MSVNNLGQIHLDDPNDHPELYILELKLDKLINAHV